jgi:hypothetical protein
MRSTWLIVMFALLAAAPQVEAREYLKQDRA